nr:unnamed protein product [Rangifer tarandus platyrhynchus]
MNWPLTKCASTLSMSSLSCLDVVDMVGRYLTQDADLDPEAIERDLVVTGSDLMMCGMATGPRQGLSTQSRQGISARSRSMRCLRQLWGFSCGCTRLSHASQAFMPFRAIWVTRFIRASLAFSTSHHATSTGTWVCGLHEHSRFTSAPPQPATASEGLRHRKETMPLDG